MSEENVKQEQKKDLDLLNRMKALPGGLVIIPLVIAVLIATFVPQAFQIGGYVTALFYDGNAAMMGFFLIVCGSTINVKQVGMPLYKGVTLTAMKFILGVIVGLAVGKICGPEGFLGLAPFVWIAALTNSNGSLYISLSSQFGNATDTGAISILSLNDGPFFTLIALGATGLANIPLNSLIATLVPILIGFIWGNLDEGFRKACGTAQPIVTFFMTISIGAKTDVKTIVTAGAAGVILGLASAATAVIFFYVFQLLVPKKERNAMGAAVGTTALNSAMTPAAVAEADPTMAQYTEMATAQCATASIITLFLCPFIVAFFDRRMQKKQQGIYSPEGWAHFKVESAKAAQ
ncbi:2-keto-3-deoxygluconate permease [Aequitasia blattaphilus]|uniref:2-keto-3-deoxygluconate permease n=1 Tax=Aequitasia blattaphilus TaxID=2949332 RepID=A0ABT1E8J9_9FIRM|nr:2-keto-3-deoxygluconate permease [Aequitasia blattaphilus]MCP1102143.1 2-keto-3-deoxygluconate permease [Aequitasia blattaphilus]MCR8614783.1 2-keto-3-deoxygluconate permease [Aequitasia blattaphilus]